MVAMVVMSLLLVSPEQDAVSLYFFFSPPRNGIENGDVSYAARLSKRLQSLWKMKLVRC